MRQVPLLVLSDAPEQSTGLARITRDLACLLLPMPEFRIATLGLGGWGSRQFGWQQYQLSRYPDGQYEYGELTLPQVWDDWSAGEPGIVFTIWDLSRLLWLSRPENVRDDTLRNWLINWRASGNRLWSYLPIDSTGPGDKLTAMSRETLLGIDRILTYSPWAEGVVRRTIGDEEADRRGTTWMPHGLNMEVFHP